MPWRLGEIVLMWRELIWRGRPRPRLPAADTKPRSATGPRSQSSSRPLKNNSPSTAACVTKKYARSGRAAEPDIQLLIAGGASAEGSSVARDPGHGGRGAGPVVGSL